MPGAVLWLVARVSDEGERKRLTQLKRRVKRLLDGRKEWERFFFFFLACQLSSLGLLDYPEGHWSRDWMIAAASTGLVPARCGWVKKGKEVKGQEDRK